MSSAADPGESTTRDDAPNIAPRRIDPRLVAAGGGLLVAAGLVATAWTCDDAWITFRSVEQMVDGHGPRWNPHERVQAYTHPLWFLAVAALRLVAGHPATAATVLSVALGVATFWLLGRRLAWRADAVALLLAVAAGSRALVDFSTSGLEDPLTHFLLVFFALRVCQIGQTSGDEDPRTLRSLAGPAGLLFLCRPDSALLVAPPLLWALWRRRSAGLGPLLRALLPGAILVALWTLFSVVYYGFPFPNTAYAKLGAGVPAAELWSHGVHYLANALRWDPLTPLVIVLGTAAWWRQAVRGGAAMAVGMALHLLYVVRIGGDFMAGRFLSETFVLGLVGLVVGGAFEGSRDDRTPGAPRGWLFATLLAYLVLWPLSPLRLGDASSSYRFDDPGEHGIADERAFYDGRQSHDRFERQWPVAVWQSQPGPREHFEVGYAGYVAGNDTVVIDRFALADPLLARLPAADGWTRIGHFRRDLPAGYEETLATGTNRLENPLLRAFYDDLRLATHGPLFATGRWAAIWRLNVGSAAARPRFACLDPPCRELVFHRLPPQLFRPLLPTVDPADGRVERVQHEDSRVVVEGRLPFDDDTPGQLVRVFAPTHATSSTMTPREVADTSPGRTWSGFRVELDFESAETARRAAPVVCVAVRADVGAGDGDGARWRLLPSSGAACAALAR